MTEKTGDHNDIIEVLADLKRGLRTTKTATAELVKLGFTEDVARALMKSMKKVSTVELQGYSKQTPNQRRGYLKWRKERFGCSDIVGIVEPDNKSPETE
jgi:hypothetical protein